MFIIAIVRVLVMTSFLWNLCLLVDRHLVAGLHWNLLAVFPGLHLTLLDWLLDWNLWESHKERRCDIDSPFTLLHCSLGTL